MTQESDAAAQSARRRKWLKRAVVGLLGVAVLGPLAAGVAILGLFYFHGRDLPDYSQLADYEPPVVTHIHAGDGSLLTDFAIEERMFVPVEAMPLHLKQAFLSAEDKTFYSHPGFDIFGIARAMVGNVGRALSGARPVGASTISQQVARIFLIKSNEVSYSRKLKELILTLRLERALSKDRILELYLNQIYLGQRAYGVAAAARNYFGKSLDELSLAEMAYLAAIPKGPANYHPVRHRERAVARRNWVLGQMMDNGYISKEQRDRAMAAPLAPGASSMGRVFRADYFLEDVRREVYALYGPQALYEGGLSVRTTLDPRLQSIAESALRQGLVAYDRRHGWRGPIARIEPDGDWRAALKEKAVALPFAAWRLAAVLGVDDANARIGLLDGAEGVVPLDGARWARPWLRGEYLGPEVKSLRDVLSPGDVIAVSAKEEGRYHLEQVPAIEGALVAMDPHTGRVFAMVGGLHFAQSEFNRASQAKRQPGSAFKPFVYAAALEAGYTPSSLVLDAPFALDQGGGQGVWKPRNSSNKFYGPSTLRLGLELSRNLMTVRLAQAIGMERVADMAARFDITPDLQKTLAMALGAGETTLLRLTAGYAMLANGGRKIEPTLIDRIQDRYGRTIFKHDNRPCPDCVAETWTGQAPPVLPDNRPRILDARTAYQITHMLEGVVQRGTGRRIGELGRTLAGKTGTTNEEKDAWFIGFSPDLAVGVFTGFDEPRSLGPREEGASAAAPIFKAFMAAALKGEPDVPFRIPSGIRLVRVNAKTGAPPQADDPPAELILEAFIPGTEPKPGEMPTLDGSAAIVQSEQDLRNEAGGIY
ncbi:MAG: penicillin-binding protein 1A [Pseudomonadota bacterium]